VDVDFAFAFTHSPNKTQLLHSSHMTTTTKNSSRCNLYQVHFFFFLPSPFFFHQEDQD
jgi:hypothetical protein